MTKYNREYTDKERARMYSSLFSRANFTKILNKDLSDFDREIVLLDKNKIKPNQDYLSYLNHIYYYLSVNYRNEYIYKNTIINDLLLRNYSTSSSVIFSEFNVGSSIADMTIFNGESKCFEIKTILDTRARLDGQLNDYLRLFQKCYIVVDERMAESYDDVDKRVGILTISKVGRSLRLNEYRKCQKNQTIDIDVLMSTLRTYEYKDMVKEFYGVLPQVSAYKMYDVCKEMMKSIPYEELNRMFLIAMKNRKNVTRFLKTTPKSLRQIQLSMNLTSDEICDIKNVLLNTINI